MTGHIRRAGRGESTEGRVQPHGRSGHRHEVLRDEGVKLDGPSEQRALGGRERDGKDSGRRRGRRGSRVVDLDQGPEVVQLRGRVDPSDPAVVAVRVQVLAVVQDVPGDERVHAGLDVLHDLRPREVVQRDLHGVQKGVCRRIVQSRRVRASRVDRDVVLAVEEVRQVRLRGPREQEPEDVDVEVDLREGLGHNRVEARRRRVDVQPDRLEVVRDHDARVGPDRVVVFRRRQDRRLDRTAVRVLAEPVPVPVDDADRVEQRLRSVQVEPGQRRARVDVGGTVDRNRPVALDPEPTHQRVHDVVLVNRHRDGLAEVQIVPGLPSKVEGHVEVTGVRDGLHTDRRVQSNLGEETRREGPNQRVNVALLQGKADHVQAREDHELDRKKVLGEQRVGRAGPLDALALAPVAGICRNVRPQVRAPRVELEHAGAHDRIDFVRPAAEGEIRRLVRAVGNRGQRGQVQLRGRVDVGRPNVLRNNRDLQRREEEQRVRF